MPNSEFVPVNGILQSISPMAGDCCRQLAALNTSNGSVNFVISSETYVVNQIRLQPGMPVTAFYDASRPVPLIYPPQYQAVVIAQNLFNGSFALQYFDRSLTAVDQSLKLNLAPTTQIVTANGQDYHCSLAGQLLLVYYQTTTRSIPPQTTPLKIIVMC